MFLGPHISPLSLLPGCCIYGQLLHTMDKSSSPLSCSVPPLYECSLVGIDVRQRSAHFMPTPIGPSSRFLSRTLCLGKVFHSCFFKGIGQPAKPFAPMQEWGCLISGYLLPHTKLMTSCFLPQDPSTSIPWHVLPVTAVHIRQILHLFCWIFSLSVFLEQRLFFQVGHVETWSVCCLEPWGERRSELKGEHHLLWSLGMGEATTL